MAESHRESLLLVFCQLRWPVQPRSTLHTRGYRGPEGVALSGGARSMPSVCEPFTEMKPSRRRVLKAFSNVRLLVPWYLETWEISTSLTQCFLLPAVADHLALGIQERDWKAHSVTVSFGGHGLQKHATDRQKQTTVDRLAVWLPLRLEKRCAAAPKLADSEVPLPRLSLVDLGRGTRGAGTRLHQPQVDSAAPTKTRESASFTC